MLVYAKRVYRGAEGAVLENFTQCFQPSPEFLGGMMIQNTGDRGRCSQSRSARTRSILFIMI